jgi:hypothetical protein
MKRALPFLLLLACGGSGATIDPSLGDAAKAGEVPDGGDAAAPKDDAARPDGPTVRIRLAVSTEPFRHSDGLSGQTPVAQKIGISGLLLYTSAGDTAPLVVYDMGKAFVLADLGAGQNTLLAEVPMKSLRAGRYRYARTFISHVEYEVATQMHAGGLSTAGTLAGTQALSDGVTLLGGARNGGFYHYQFKIGGSPYGAPAEGLDAPMPQLPDAGGFVLKKEAGRTYYGYPCDVLVDPAAVGDWTVTMTLNMDKNFRWADETAPGYAAGVWDTTPVTFERVMRFGANAFDLGSTRP